MEQLYRPPKFNDIYLDQESFDLARQAIDNRAALIAGRQIQASPAKDIQSILADTLSAAETSFSMRHFGEELAHAIQSKIVPACLGRIENLLLTVPWHGHQNGTVRLNPREVRHFQTLIKALGDDRIYTIVCHPDTRAEIEEWQTLASNVTFQIVEMPIFKYSIWAQDAYVGLRGASGQNILVEGVLFPRQEDMAVADEIASQSNVLATQSYLYFQGGNILGGDDVTLIGMDYMLRNYGRHTLKTIEAVSERYTKLFGTKILFLGGNESGDYKWYREGKLTGYGTQPIFHIDMYVSRTGVLGEDGKEIVFLGRPSRAKEIVGVRPEQDGVDIDQYDKFFDQTEEQLREYFDVRILPLFIVHGDVNNEGYRRKREYYNLTFNNVVIENYDETRNIVLSAYADNAESSRFGVDSGIRRELEAEAKRAWENVGFSVLSTDSHEILAHAMSSLHCITKTLQRSQAVNSA